MTINQPRQWSIVVLLACFACGGPLHYQTRSSGNAPGADANIDAEVNEKQRQTHLTIEVTNLPPPDRIEPSSQHYVAWYRRGSNNSWTRVAALNYEAESREATLVGSVPELEFVLEITAEPATDVAAPSPHVVFVQEIGS